MDVTSILTAVGVSSVLPIVFSAIFNRKLNNATAGNSIADYADKVIKQSDERVAQALSDKERAIVERDAAYAEAKGQRKAKQDWRDKYFEEQKEHHAIQLKSKDLQAQLQEEHFHRCEVNGCINRVPPRRRKES